MKLLNKNIIKNNEVYIGMNDDIYYLKDDLSKEKVGKVPFRDSRKKKLNIMLFYKTQFDFAKESLLKADNEFKLDMETAEIYNEIGFLSDKELKDYKIADERYKGKLKAIYDVKNYCKEDQSIEIVESDINKLIILHSSIEDSPYLEGKVETYKNIIKKIKNFKNKKELLNYLNKKYKSN